MKYLLGLCLFINLNLVLACDNKGLQKQVNVDIQKINCEALETVIKARKDKTPGRHLYKDKINPTLSDDFCSTPEWLDKINYAKSIAEPETRRIITAAVLEEAEEFGARDAVLNDVEIKLCN